MAAALLLGNLALLVDGSTYKNAMVERAAKNRHPHPHPHPEVSPLIMGKKNSTPSSFPAPPIFLAIDGGSRMRRKTASSGSNSSSKIGASSSSSDNGGGGGGGGGSDWEEDLRRRLKELEEMKELEKKAEEIQRQIAEEVADEEETEEEKRERVKRELQKVAKEQAERRETAKLMFELGQKAYGRGMYARAIEFLEAALTIIPRPTVFGGEIQIWLAMAYEANNRHRDCIALYQELEKKHPSVGIRRQAAELRYILQAPKLKISKDEMVTIPLIGSSYDSYAGTWSDKYKDRDQRKTITLTTNQLPSSRDLLGDFMVWRPPSGWEKNRNFWLFLALWFGLIGTALFLQS